MCGANAILFPTKIQIIGETYMLSPHEFATLMLVNTAADQIDPTREELDTLLKRQLVAFEQLASGRQRPRLTSAGNSVLRAMVRTR